MTKAYVTRSGVLEAKDRKIVEISCPEWGGDVRIRSMSARERIEWVQKFADADGDLLREKAAMAAAHLVAISVVDASGRLVFTLEDVEALADKNATTLDEVVEAAMQLNKLGKKAIEAEAGNSEASR